MILLSTAYLGNIQYYTKLLSGRAAIDGGEHYRKQSYRNRCRILGVNGPIDLTVPVLKTSGEKTPIRRVRIDPTKAWRHNHWHSIRSAYAGAPFFDHYAPAFEGFYGREYEFLWDWNRDLQQTALNVLKIETDISYSDTYLTPSPGDADWRDTLSDKPRLSRPDPDFVPVPYYQVFSPAEGFAPGLSVLDLLFCEGPAAAGIIRLCAGGSTNP